MRKLLYCLLCGYLLSAGGNTTIAQIHQPRQRFLEVGGGLADGVRLAKSDNAAYWFKASMGKYGKKEGVWQVGLTAQAKYYSLADQLIEVDQYFLEGSFSPRGFRSAERRLYISPGIGTLLGFERADDRKIDPSGSVKLSKPLVGFLATLNSEVNITLRTALFAYARGNFLPSSQVQFFHFQYGVGIRLNYFKR